MVVAIPVLSLESDCFKSRFCSVKLFNCFRYDPNCELPLDVETEQDRVLFIKAVAQFMVNIRKY